MAVRRRPRLVEVIQKALADGPVARDALLTAVQQAGFRVDPGVLWETCETHGLADLKDDMWVPRGWSVPITGDTATGGGPSERRPPDADPLERSFEERAAAEVRRLAATLGLPLIEPVPPAGPVPRGWTEVATAASRAFRDELPPVVIADTPAAEEWLRRSPFEKSGVAAAVSQGRPPVRLAALTEQYRMRQRIGDTVSTAFYPESPLTTAPSVAKRTIRSRASWATSQLVVVDTSGMRPRTARRQGMLSRYNLMHAQLIAALTAGTSGDTHDLALITPFAPQARLLESLLPEGRLEQWAASTVHRFQGGERDIVIYDTVDTGHGASPRHPWFTEGGTGSEGARLLNVAASRARDHLLIVGALDSLHRPGSARTPVWTFFAHLLHQAERLPWEQALDLSAVTERVDSALVERLKADIARADTVEMWLPGRLLHSFTDLVPALRSIRNQDTETEAVTIWVEPEPDGHLPSPALHARSEGVNIRPLRPILESGAVIGDVVWSASESLCGPNPGVVLRTEHPGFADAVRRAARRRPSTGPGSAPGSGESGDQCGRCQRMLIRYEHGRFGEPDLRYECASCDRKRRPGGVGRSR